MVWLFLYVKTIQYPILKLTIFLVIGILASDYVFISEWTLLGGIGVLIFVLIQIYFYCKKNKKTVYWPSFLVLLLMVLLGVFVCKIHAPSFSKSHYSHLKNITNKDLHQLEFVIKKRLKPTTYNHRYYVELLKIDSTLVSGTLLINLSKDSTTANFKVNSKILTSAQPFRKLNHLSIPINLITKPI